MSGINPDLNTSIDKIFLVLDDIGGSDLQVNVLGSIITHLDELGLNESGLQIFSNQGLRERTEHYGQFDRENFDRDFDGLVEPISIETLLEFSQHDNPEFSQRLKESELPLKELLWKEYQRRFQQEDSLHTSVEHYEMSDSMAAQHPESHILTVLFNHKVISPQVQNDGAFNYHFVGRGFYGFGSTSTIDPDLGKKGRYKVMVPMGVVAGEDLETQKAFARKIVNHEWLGHARYDLPDHFDVPSDRCIMTPPTSLRATIDSSVNKPGIYFCEQCTEKIGYKPQLPDKL